MQWPVARVGRLVLWIQRSATSRECSEYACHDLPYRYNGQNIGATARCMDTPARYLLTAGCYNAATSWISLRQLVAPKGWSVVSMRQLVYRGGDSLQACNGLSNDRVHRFSLASARCKRKTESCKVTPARCLDSRAVVSLQRIVVSISKPFSGYSGSLQACCETAKPSEKVAPPCDKAAFPDLGSADGEAKRCQLPSFRDGLMGIGRRTNQSEARRHRAGSALPRIVAAGSGLFYREVALLPPAARSRWGYLSRRTAAALLCRRATGRGLAEHTRNWLPPRAPRSAADLPSGSPEGNRREIGSESSLIGCRERCVPSPIEEG